MTTKQKTFDYRRSHHCGLLRKQDTGKAVTLSGWVHRRRDHGGLIFIDLRDRFGLTQIVFDPKINLSLHELANHLRNEWVISVKGIVRPRLEGMANPQLATGDIEVEAQEMEILSKAKTPPFAINEETDANEELRLKYRYLDMRKGIISNNLSMRHKAMLAVRNHLDSESFLEICTPMLAKSTPEGSRDYLVPSRIYPGKFYALPQSPQIFKQLLMVGGMDRYFQIATCMRDEDLRADRQPEFAQIDMEMSFGIPDDLFHIVERLVQHVFKICKGLHLPAPFRRMTYHDCMEYYGTDKPDLRFDMRLHRIDTLVKRSECTLFLEQIQAGGTVKGLCVRGGGDLSRKTLEDYVAFVGKFGARGLAWMKCQDGGLATGISKFFTPALQKELRENMGAVDGDMLLFVADEEARVNQALDHLRRHLAKERNLILEGQIECLWVTEFPLFKKDEETGRIASEHHPFTAPLDEDIHLLRSHPLQARSSSYDLVMNGYELASGSQRIHNGELQATIFDLLRLTPEELQEKFGFFIEALSYGTPPHLGIALGLDRLLMILVGTENIRDVVAFPKTQKASDLMMEAPSEVTLLQLKELKLLLEK